MLYSMTGFGRHTTTDNIWSYTWEIRSVNHKYLDIKWRLPNLARPFEDFLEKTIRTFAKRGRLEVTLEMQAIQATEEITSLIFDENLANTMLHKLTAFAQTQHFDFKPDYNQLLNLSFLWSNKAQPDETLYNSLETSLKTTLMDWNTSRNTEALALALDLSERINNMKIWIEKITDLAPQIKQDKFKQTKERINLLLQSLNTEPNELNENRFIQECAILADKLDVSEEITRLNSHIDRLSQLLSQGTDTGRKMDFTLQECFREINTCGNKIQDTAVAYIIVDFKTELEKCREQVQNLE